MSTSLPPPPSLGSSSPASSSVDRTRAKFSFWRGFLLVFFVLVLLVVLIFGALYVYLKMYPDVVSQKISEELQKHTGIEATFSGVDVTLFPLPALSFVDVKLTQKKFTLSVAYATVTPSLLDMVDGSFSLGHISLWRPVLQWRGQNIAVDASATRPMPTELTMASAGVVSSTSATSPMPVTSTTSNISATPPTDSLAVSSSVQKTTVTLATVEDMTKHLQDILNNADEYIPTLFFGSVVEVKHGKVIWEEGNIVAQCENIQSFLRLGSLGAVHGDMSFSSAYAFIAQKPYARLNDFSVEFSGDVFEDIEATLQTAFTVSGLVQQGHVTTKAKYTVASEDDDDDELQSNIALDEDSLLQLSWDTQGQLLWEGAPLAIQSTGIMEGHLEDILYFRDVRVQMEKDAALLNASLHVSNMAQPVLKGSIAVERLSLSQWFGFARNLPLGLQNTLDTIKGNVQFVMNMQGLDVHSVEAEAAHAHFTGKGGVESWSKPVIFLDIASDEVHLGQVYPEIEAKQPSALTFAHTPLLSTTPAAAQDIASKITVDYDIRIGTKKLLAWDLLLDSMSFRCSSAGVSKNQKIPKKHKNAVFLDFATEKFYGGRAEGEVILYTLPSKKMAYDITGILRNVQAEAPVKRIFGFTLFDGRISVDTSFTAQGASVSEFLLSKQGMAALRVDDGRFYGQSDKAFPFKLLTLASDFTAQNPAKVQGKTLPPSLNYKGHWNASLRAKDFSTKASWNGTVALTGQKYATVEFRDVPIRATLDLAPELTKLSSALTMNIDGRLSLNTKKHTASVTRAQASIPDFGSLHVSGEGAVDFAKELSWSVNFSGSTASLSELLWRVDEQVQSAVPATLPQRMTGSAKISFAKNLLRVEALSLRTDAMHVKGYIRRTFEAIPQWNFDLSLNSLNFDTLFAKNSSSATVQDLGKQESTERGHRAGTGMASPKKGVNLAGTWLDNLRAQGKLRLENLRIKKLLLQDVFIPIHIEKSRMTCDSITATMYEGTLYLQFTGHGQGNTLQSTLKAETQAVNLFALTQDLGMTTALSGPASVNLALQGPLTDSILAGLKGTWSVHVGRGFMQSRDGRGNLSGRPTYITSFSDNGTLEHGILRSHRFFLMGPDIQVTGGGFLNLVNNTLDMSLVADMGKLVDIPVRYYGSLNNPQRDLNDGAVILATIGTLGTGVFDLIGGIFDILFGAF